MSTYISDKSKVIGIVGCELCTFYSRRQCSIFGPLFRKTPFQVNLKCYDFMYSHTSFQLAIRNKRFQDCFVLFCCVRHTILYTRISTYVSDK